MKIQEVKIKNFKGLGEVSALLNGRNVYLVAPNGKGKTTFIDAAFGAMPKEALKKGERKGEVSVQLDEGLTVQFKFSERNPKAKLSILDSTGTPQKRPAELFKTLFGVSDFKIDEFLNKPVSKQVEFLKNLVGIDWTEVNEQYDELYKNRTYFNRKLKELEGEIAGRAYDPNLKKIDTTILQIGLNEGIEHNNKVSGFEQRLEDKVQKLEEIHEQIKALQEQAKATQEEIEKGREWLKKNPKRDIDFKASELEKAIQTNEAYNDNKKVGELRRKALETANELDGIEEQIEHIKEVKRKELEENPLPVKGLEFDEEFGLLLDGLPFTSNQINTARRIIAGLEIQFEMLGDVKIARFDGSLLDNESLKAVEDWAEQKGVQLFVELVERNGTQLKIEVSQD